MKLSQVGAQLYTLRDQMKTPEDIATSLAKVRDIGYQTVQVSGIGPIEVTALKDLLDKNELTCCITHEPTQEILENPEKIVERMKALDCHQTAPGGSRRHHSQRNGVRPQDECCWKSTYREWYHLELPQSQPGILQSGREASHGYLHGRRRSALLPV